MSESNLSAHRIPKSTERGEDKKPSSTRFEQWLIARKVKSPLAYPDIIKPLAEEIAAHSAMNGVSFVHSAKEVLKHLAVEDWQHIDRSDYPILSLISTLNFYRLEHINEWRESLNSYAHEPFSFEERPDCALPTASEQSSFAGLPLVHSTSLETLRKVIDQGSLLPDSVLQAQTGDMQLLPIGQTYDRPWGGGHTTGVDRSAGLDEYVFSYFGRPPQNRSYGGLQLLLKPDRFYEDDRSFATRNDLLDEVIVLHDDGENWYRDQVVQGRYFLRAAIRSLKRDSLRRRQWPLMEEFLKGETDTKNQDGGTLFSTWEVKTPSFTVDEIDSIVVTTAEDLRQLRGDLKFSPFPVKFAPSWSEFEIFLKEELGEKLELYLPALRSQTRTALDLSRFVEAEFPGALAAISTKLQVELLFDPVAIYRLSDAAERGRSEYARALVRGGAERVQVIKNAEQSDISSAWVIVGQLPYPLPEDCNLELLEPGYLFVSKEEAQHWLDRQYRISRSRFESNKQLGLGGMAQSGSWIKKTIEVVEISTLKEELEQRLSNRWAESSPLKHYIVNNGFVMIAAAEDNI